jgi:hypothetical protein
MNYFLWCYWLKCREEGGQVEIDKEIQNICPKSWSPSKETLKFLKNKMHYFLRLNTTIECHNGG